MRFLLHKSILPALFFTALTPVAHAQGLHDIPVQARIGGVEIQAVGTAYNNTVTFLGRVALPQGTTVDAGNTLTRLIADDITFAPNFTGLSITTYTWSDINLNAVPVSARPRVRFWLPDGVNGTPGTFITGFTFNPIPYPAKTHYLISPANPVAQGVFVIPPGGKIWAGLTHDNNTGATGATAEQLENFGPGLWDPPTVGASADIMFRTTSGGSFVVDNPVGATYDFAHASDPTDPAKPYASMGWRFVVTANIVSGIINLEGAVNKAQPVMLDFQIGGVSKFTRNVTLGADGSFSVLAAPNAIGTPYTVGIKGTKWLKKNVMVDVSLVETLT